MQHITPEEERQLGRRAVGEAEEGEGGGGGGRSGGGDGEERAVYVVCVEDAEEVVYELTPRTHTVGRVGRQQFVVYETRH